MITSAVTAEQFSEIKSYLQQNDVSLLISDFNGVLDDYYIQKYAYLTELLGDEHAAHTADFAVFTDTQYMADRTATIEQSLQRFAEHKGLILGDRTQAVLRRGMQPSQITSQAVNFLNDLTIPYVIYTSQGERVITESLGSHQADVYHRDRTGREKPSTINLKMIAEAYQTPYDKICVLGDGLIDDLMPARLLGMKTILVTPFTDKTFVIR